MSVVNTVSNKQPTVLCLDWLRPTTDFQPVPDHSRPGAGQYFVFSTGPGTAQVGRKGYPYMRVDAVKHGVSPIKAFRKQHTVFVGEPGEYQPVPVPAAPVIIQEISDANRGHRNLSNDTVISSINHVDTLADEGQSRVFTAFLLTLAFGLEYRSLRPFGKLESVIAYSQAKTRDFVLSHRPINEINPAVQLDGTRI